MQTIQKYSNWLLSKLTQAWSKIDFASIWAFILRRKWWLLALALILFAANKTYDHFNPPDSKKGGPQTISSVIVERKDVPFVIESTGTIVAASIVDVRPQITSIVTKVNITEGQIVKKGDLLFTLDDRTDKANYDRAQALANDAQRQLARAKELVAKNFISKAGLDTAQANAASTQAAARAAAVQLSYNYLRSPIDGRAGIINVFPGSLVQASNVVVSSTSSTATSTSGAMVTITQLDPINVQFTVPERDIPLLLKARKDDAPLPVSVSIGNMQATQYPGQVYVIDNQVDPVIGAVRLKARLENRNGALIPGQFARIKLEASTLVDVMFIPSQAVVINPKGRFVYLVEKDDDKVVMKPVKVLYEYQGNAVIDGIDVGSRVVVEGKQNLRPGSKVREAKPTNTPKALAKPAPTAPAAPEKK
ncbi:MAG: efflux RND transporter periplasmic adaptor subunit [Polynucleobacter sp.]|nr:efflux RND transporter periplasmic adaptor subunit [Polynucleobacter sp.]